MMHTLSRPAIESRARLIHSARSLRHAAELEAMAEGRAVNPGALARADALVDEANATGSGVPLVLRGAHPTEDYGGSRLARLVASPAYRSAWRGWLETGRFDRDRLPAECRGLVTSTDSAGGSWVVPTAVASDVVRLVDSLTFLRADPWTGAPNATIETAAFGAKTVRVPTTTARFSDYGWTSEVAALPEDTSMTLGAVDITPATLAKLIKVSKRIDLTGPALEAFIAQELAVRFAQSEEAGYLAGPGTGGQPSGMFGGGIPSSRDITTGNTATAIGADNLLAMKFGLRQIYLADPTCAWVLNKDVARTIYGLKDTAGRYLWNPAGADGQPDRLLGIKCYYSDFAPTSLATGSVVAILGALRFVTIAEVGDLEIQRLDQRFADTNEVGFIGRRWVGYSVTNPNAFVRSKLA